MLLLILIIAILALPDFSKLMINADSYAILLPAQRFLENWTFSFRLGENGDFFAPLFYRGGFSLVIALIAKIANLDLMMVARNIIAASYILTPVAAYFIVKKLLIIHQKNSLTVWQADWLATASSGLIIFSYSFSQWAKVLMSETPTIFLLALSLFFLTRNIKENDVEADTWWEDRNIDLSAICLGLALLFRLEMIIFLFAFVYLLGMMEKRRWWIKWFYLAIVLSIWLIYAGWLYMSNLNPNNWLTKQIDILYYLAEFHRLFAMALFSLIVVFFLVKRWPYLLVFPIGLLAWLIYYYQVDVRSGWEPFWLFINYDLVLALGAVLGIVGLWWGNKKLLIFFLFSLLPLGILYYSRGEYRYYVHLILGMALLTACGWNVIWVKFRGWKRIKAKSGLMMGLVLAMVLGQVYLFQKKSFLPEESYEQKVIEETMELIKSDSRLKGDIVICSMFSEAIYYSTKISSIDCFNGPSDILRRQGKSILVIVDEDIARNQKEFVNLLETKYAGGLIKKKWLVANYQEKNTVSLTNYPLRWYLIRGE